MKQYRVVGLGNYIDYYSYFLYGIMEGTVQNNHLFRSVPLFGQSLTQVKQQVLWFKPHLILCHMIFNKQPHNMSTVFEMLRDFRKHGIKIGYHAGDARPQPRYSGRIDHLVDFALCNHNLMESYSNIWKIPCYYWPYQCLSQPDADFVDQVKIFKKQLVFTGSLQSNVHHAPRAAFINKLKSKMDIAVYPTPESGNTRFRTAEVAASANGVLGFQMGLDIPGYIDVRPWQYIGAGALYFHDSHGNIERFFRNKVHYLSFKRDDVNDFLRTYDYYVNQFPEKAMEIKRQGLEYGQKYHSSKERMAAVFSMLEGKGYYIYALNKDNEIERVENPWVK